MEQLAAPAGLPMDALSHSSFTRTSTARFISSRYQGEFRIFCRPFRERIICHRVGRAMGSGFTSLRKEARKLSRFGRSPCKAVIRSSLPGMAESRPSNQPTAATFIIPNSKRAEFGGCRFKAAKRPRCWTLTEMAGQTGHSVQREYTFSNFQSLHTRRFSSLVSRPAKLIPYGLWTENPGGESASQV